MVGLNLRQNTILKETFMKNDIKIIAMDLDGTLTDSNKNISKYTRNIIKRAAERGTNIVLATGRPLFGCENVISMLGLQDMGGYVLSYNGVQIYDILKRKILVETALSQELVDEVYSFTKKYKELNICTYQCGKIYAEKEYDKYIELEGVGCASSVHYVKCLKDVITEAVPKYVITAEPKIMKKYKTAFDREFSERVDLVQTEEFYLEVLPKGINKGTALEYLANYLGVKKDQVAAFGDAENDLEMLRYAGMSFAMENASEEIKKEAMYIAESNDNDGVGKAIKKYILDECL